jgi:hypothetical protein
MQLEELVELASGVDALYLSGRAAQNEPFMQMLDEFKFAAIERGSSVPFEMAGEDWLVANHGFHKYRFCLQHPYGQVGISPSEALPTLWVQPRAEFIHAAGPRVVADWFDDVLGYEFGAIRWSVNRLDLHADFQGLTIREIDATRFVTRAKHRSSYTDSGDLTGFVFGKRSTGTIGARIYDKTREIKDSGHAYWPEIWGDRFDPESIVWRVEFEIGREGLRSYGIQSPTEVLDAAGALWTSLTHSWLRLTDPTADMTSSRWPTAPEWTAVQRAGVSESALGLEKVSAGLEQGSIDLLLPTLVGCLAKFGAILDAEALSGVFAYLPQEVQRYCEMTETPFAERIKAKRSLLRLR